MWWTDRLVSLYRTSQTSCMHLVHLSCSSLSCKGQLRVSVEQERLEHWAAARGCSMEGHPLGSHAERDLAGSCSPQPQPQPGTVVTPVWQDTALPQGQVLRRIYLGCPSLLPLYPSCAGFPASGPWELERPCSGVSSLLHPFSRSEILLRVKVFPICCWSGTVFRNKSDFFEVEI